jgi:drug/metabolite transporter (DMT)-like permease
MNMILLYAVGSMLLWGIHDFTLKRLTTELGALATAFYKSLLHVTLIGIFFVSVGFTIPSGVVWWFILLFGLLGAVGWYAFVKAIDTGMVSLEVPVAHGYILVVAVLSAVFLNEHLSITQYAALLVIVIGIALLSLDVKRLGRGMLSIRSGIRWALLTALCWGVIYTIIKVIADRIGPYASAFYQDFAVIVFIALFFLMSRPPLDRRVLRKNLIIVVAAALASSAATVLMLLAVTGTKVSVAMGIVAASPIVTFILATMFLKERPTLLQAIAVLAIVCGIIVLGGAV